jgi:hypothetical protein
MRSICLAVALALLMLFVYGCSSSSKSTPPGDDHNKELKKIDSLITTQSDYSDTLNVLFTHLDSTVAKDSLVKILLADPNVQTAQTSSQGIAIQYTNGMRGGVFLNSEDLGGPVPPEDSPKLGKNLGGNPGLGHKPSSKKTIFLNPSYWERQEYADPLTATADAGFAKIGFDAFEKYVNDQCTIDKFTALEGYGVVHIYSHGWAWPNKNAIQEVYLLTGEAYSSASPTLEKYLDEVQSGKILMGDYHNAIYYWISPSFFAAHNNFSDDTTLVYGGFCYSELGGWRDTLIQVAKAGGYVGFDWHVWTSWNALWARSMYQQLCDTSKASSMNLGDWRTTGSIVSNTYWDDEPECQKWVSVWNYGYTDLVLWRSLKILGIDPSAAPVGETVQVRGVGFGATKGTSTISFNGVLASPTSWSDTLIVTQVPVGTTDGNVVVTVGAEHSNGFPFRLAEVTISIDADSVRMMPYDTTIFKATVTGTADTVVTWSVLEQQPSAGWFQYAYTNPTRFQVSLEFVGICHVVATAHADPSKKDTVTVIVSIMDKLRESPFFFLQFDGKMIYSVNCTGTTHDDWNGFATWNSQSDGIPALRWEGNRFSLNGTAVYGDWPYHDSMVVSGTMSAMGDTLLTFRMYYRQWACDLPVGGSSMDHSYREFRYQIEVTNIPLEAFQSRPESGLYHDFQFRVEGSSLQSNITRVEEFYHESKRDGSCQYEHIATTADWNNTNPVPRLAINFDVKEAYSSPALRSAAGGKR